MHLPISSAMMVAALTALRVLCFIIMVLFLLLAIRAQFDPSITMGWGMATFLAAAFWAGATACGLARKAIADRINRG
jgi:Na+-transporting methylmalonyl-CoA/oxaloacetate decarboxylase beta subunit